MSTRTRKECPWATVLELAGGLAKGDSDPVSILTDLTRGIYFSNWTTFAGGSHFINPVGKMVYDPSVSNETLTGPPTSAQTAFSSQNYDLTQFLSAIEIAGNLEHQECSDNSDLLTTFAAALGINAAPLWVANGANMTAPLAQTALYVPAGTGHAVQTVFNFHQFVLYNGNVFDPSTAAPISPAIDPWHNIPLTTYMTDVFLGQGAYVNAVVAVTTLH